MLCASAVDLIKELERSSNDVLPAYNTDTVRIVLNEMKDLYDQNVDLATTSRDQADALFALKVRHKGLRRNKRCLLAYLWNRIARIKEMRWHFGSLLPSTIKGNLSPSEEQWFTNYSKSLANYMKSIGNDGGLDLFQDLHPPKSLHLEVRCKDDHGEIVLDNNEVIVLTKGTQYKLPRSSCESLIYQDILEHVE